MLLEIQICELPSVLEVFRIIYIAILIIKIVVPIILMVSLMIDFAKEVTNNKNDFSMVGNVVVKKIIAAVLIFLIPTIINIIMRINGLDTTNILSCLNNASHENIQKLQVVSTKKLLTYTKNNFTASQYSAALSEINKIENDEVRNDMLTQLNDLKIEYDKEEARKKIEKEMEERETAKKILSNKTAVVNYVAEARRIANDDTHGYNNNLNYNLYNPDVDCGTFVTYSLQFAGVIPTSVYMPPTSPALAIQALRPYGFELIDFNKSKLKFGDILIRYGHTEIFTGNNKSIGAHHDIDGRMGDSTGQEVSEGALSDNWVGIIRYDGADKAKTNSERLTQ